MWLLSINNTIIHLLFLLHLMANGIIRQRYKCNRTLAIAVLFYISFATITSIHQLSESYSFNLYAGIYRNAVFLLIILVLYAPRQNKHYNFNVFFVPVLIIYSLYQVFITKNLTTVFQIDIYSGLLRFKGWSDDPNLMGVYILIFTLATYKIRATATKAVAVITPILTQGRLHLILSAFIFIKGYSLKQKLTIIILLIIILTALFITFQHEILNYVLGRIGYDLEGRGRILLWTLAFEAFSNSPIIGNGPSYLYRTYQVTAHSDIFDVLSNFGLVGCITYWSFLFLCLKFLDKITRLIIVGASLTLTLHGQVFVPLVFLLATNSIHGRENETHI